MTFDGVPMGLVDKAHGGHSARLLESGECSIQELGERRGPSDVAVGAPVGWLNVIRELEPTLSPDLPVALVVRGKTTARKRQVTSGADIVRRRRGVLVRDLYEDVGFFVGPTGRESVTSQDQQSRLDVDLRCRKGLLQDASLCLQP